MELSLVDGEMGASIRSQDRRIAVRTTGKLGRRLTSLLDRIRYRNESDLLVVEKDAVVKSIEAFEVVVRRNWQVRMLRRAAVGSRGYLEIFKKMKARADLQTTGGWKLTGLAFSWWSWWSWRGLGVRWEERSTRGRQAVLIRFHDLCSIST